MTRLRLLYLCSAALLSGQNMITTFARGPKVFATGMPTTTVSVAPSRIATGPQGELYFGDRPFLRERSNVHHGWRHAIAEWRADRHRRARVVA
jgi:hypothetical protein